jgi:hypothetical protein
MSMAPDVMAAGLRAAAARGRLRLPADGTSMGPLIPQGSEITIVPATEPRWGEVWAFCIPGQRVVVHRCRGGEAGRWRFQGDRRSSADPLIPDMHLIGRVTTVHRSGRRDLRLGALDRWGRGAVAGLVRLRHR